MQHDRPLYACRDCGRESNRSAEVVPQCRLCAVQAEIDRLERADRPLPGSLTFEPRTALERAVHRRALKRKSYGNGVT